MVKRKTAGELAVKASSDSTVYDSLEVGYAFTETICKELETCIKNHDPIFDMDEYCLVMVIANDPLIKNLIRRKFYAWPYLPSPRPNQTVFLWNKRKQQLTKRLWVLPHVLAMETLYEAVNVAPIYRNMKAWSMAFYDGCFWQHIRKEHKIDMLSETEFLERNRAELIKTGAKEFNPIFSDPLDFSEVAIKKVINSHTTVS